MNTFFWENSEFVKKGFEIQGDDVRKGLRCVHASKNVHGFIKQEIFLTQSSLDKDYFYAVLSISVHVPDFVEARMAKSGNSDDFYTQALEVEVSKDCFDERGWGRTYHYPINDHLDFSKDLRKRLIPWLEENSDPRVLVSVLQMQLDGAITLPRAEIPLGWKIVDTLLFRRQQKIETKNEVTTRPICNKLLADVLFQLGDIELAIPYMQRWVQSNASHPEGASSYAEKLRTLA